MLVDSHCHLNSFSKIKTQEILASAKETLFIDSSTNYQSSLLSLAISKSCDTVYTALGFHPFWLNEYEYDTVAKYENLVKENKKIVAIGEVGLDNKAKEPLKEQEKVFVEFIKLAKDTGLRLHIHNRLDDLRIFDILDQYYSDYSQVIFHCFSYPAKVLERALKKNATVSFSLNILRGKKALLESLEICPLENMLLETDSPYMRIDNRDSTPLDIVVLYDFTAKFRKIDLLQLKDALAATSAAIFKNRDL